MGDELKFGEILGNFWARGEILKSCETQKRKRRLNTVFWPGNFRKIRKWRNSEQMSKIIEKGQEHYFGGYMGLYLQKFERNFRKSKFRVFRKYFRNQKNKSRKIQINEKLLKISHLEI